MTERISGYQWSSPQATGCIYCHCLYSTAHLLYCLSVSIENSYSICISKKDILFSFHSNSLHAIFTFIKFVSGTSFSGHYSVQPLNLNYYFVIEKIPYKIQSLFSDAAMESLDQNESLFSEMGRPEPWIILELLEDLPLLSLLRGMTRKLTVCSKRDSGKDVVSINQSIDTIQHTLQQAALDTASSALLPPEFLLSCSRCACLGCLTHGESHWETVARLTGGGGRTCELISMEKIHCRLNDAFASLLAVLTDLQLELIRIRYLCSNRASFSSKHGEVKKTESTDVSIEDLLVECQRCLDSVRSTSSSSLLNETFHILWKSAHPGIENALDHRGSMTETVKCTWEKEEDDDDDEVSFASPNVILEPKSSSTVLVSTDEQTLNGIPLLDVLPFDIWRRILAFLTADDDDATLYAILRTSPYFHGILSRPTQDAISAPNYWLNALQKRGVDVERLCDGTRSGMENYHDYVRSMACFRCFTRLGRRTDNASPGWKDVSTMRYAGRILHEASCLARGGNLREDDGWQDAVLGIKVASVDWLIGQLIDWSITSHLFLLWVILRKLNKIQRYYFSFVTGIRKSQRRSSNTWITWSLASWDHPDLLIVAGAFRYKIRMLVSIFSTSIAIFSDQISFWIQISFMCFICSLFIICFSCGSIFPRTIPSGHRARNSWPKYSALTSPSTAISTFHTTVYWVEAWRTGGTTRQSPIWTTGIYCTTLAKSWMSSWSICHCPPRTVTSRIPQRQRLSPWWTTRWTICAEPARKCLKAWLESVQRNTPCYAGCARNGDKIKCSYDFFLNFKFTRSRFFFLYVMKTALHEIKMTPIRLYQSCNFFQWMHEL